MSEINPLGSTPGSGAAALGRAGRSGPEVTTRTVPVRSGDKVELSQHAQMLSRLSKLPDIRADLVDRVRRQIADGNYETSDKVDAAVDKLADDL
jgi:anti-sigma28 factor (negative regulator of flagellin synthesis)